MKKTLFALAAGAVALPLAIFANSDQIQLTEINNLIRKIWVDDVKEMTVSKTQGIKEGYNTFTVHYNSGNKREWLMGAIKEMKWVPGLEESDLKLEAEPHHRSITLHSDCDNPDIHYSFGALPIEYFNGLSEHEYHDVIYQYETQLINQFAYSLGKDVKELPTERVFPYTGKNSITWFPATTEEMFKMPGKDYIGYIYQGTVDPQKGLILDHDVKWQRVTCKNVVISDVDYSISTEVSPIGIKATVKAPEGDNEPFAIFFVKEDDAKGKTADDLAASLISKLESTVYSSYNPDMGDWTKVTYKGEGTATSAQLCSGDKYYVLTVGCEIGVMTSHAVMTDLITVPMPEITDNCTFDVASEEVTASEINLDIKPSNPETVYTVFLKETGKVADPLEYFTRSIFRLRGMNQLSTTPGEDNMYVFKGEKKLNSLKNVIEGKQLLTGTDYTFYIMGIDQNGTPTTAIREFNYTPGKSDKRMTFEISFNTDKFKENELSSQWGRNLEFKVVPSDTTMKYIFDKKKLKESELSWTDEQHMDDYVKAQGKYLYMYEHTGLFEHKTSFSSDYDYDAGGYVFKPYLIFVFGYDGSATSELYLYKFEPANGNLTPVSDAAKKLMENNKSLFKNKC